MGRPPKPLAILKGIGAFREDRHGDRVDGSLSHGEPCKPKWLKGDASKAWDAIVASLSVGVLMLADSMEIAGAARWWALWREFDSALEAGEGDPYKMTMLATMAWKNFDKTAAKLGLTPVDRARLRMPLDDKRQPPDGKARFFASVN